MYKQRAFLLTLVLLGTFKWVSCDEVPVEMKEENIVKQKESTEKEETTTKKILSSTNEEPEPDYHKLYNDMMNEDPSLLEREDNHGQEEKSSARTVLDSTNFEETVKSGYTFIKFYAPWCGHCIQMAPDWNDLANHFFEKPIDGVDLTIAEVDCTESSMTCIDEGVDGYPSIKLYKDGSVMTDYYFARSLDRMKRFLGEKLIDIDQMEPNTIGVYTLNDLTFTKFVEKSDEVPVIVKYYVPWCDQCKAFQEVYDELVIKFLMEESEDIKFTEINCMDTDSLDTCTEEGVDGFPAVHIYKQGVLEDIFDDDRTVDALSNFVWQTVDPSRVESNDGMDDFMAMASLMGMGGGEEEFEECDCSEPDCDCDDEDELEEFDEGEEFDEYEEGDEVDGEEYEEEDEVDEDSDEEYEDGEDEEESVDYKEELSLEGEDENKIEETDKMQENDKTEEKDQTGNVEKSEEKENDKTEEKDQTENTEKSEEKENDKIEEKDQTENTEDSEEKENFKESITDKLPESNTESPTDSKKDEL